MSYPVAGLTASTAYYFVIRARDEAGLNSAPSAQFATATLDTVLPILNGPPVVSSTTTSSISPVRIQLKDMP